MSPMVLARLLPEAARGEQERVCHLLPIPEGGPTPSRLKALCGRKIDADDAELLTGLAGMPCIACLTSPFAQGSSVSTLTSLASVRPA